MDGSGPEVDIVNPFDTAPDGAGVDLSDILNAASMAKPSDLVDSRAALLKGINHVQEQMDIAKYGQPLKDAKLTVGQIHQLAQNVATAKATNHEPPKSIPAEPVTIPQEDSKHEQHAVLEKEYLAGNMPYSEYIAKAKAIYE